MLVRMETWYKVRDAFTEEEKDVLNTHITNEVICPRGLIVDETKLPLALRLKLSKAIRNSK